MPTAADAMYPNGPIPDLGNVRKAQAAGYPELPLEEWERWTKGIPKGGSAYKKDRPFDIDKADTSQGFMMHKDHPQLKDIQDNFDVFSIPGGRGEFLFLRQRVPMAGWEGPGSMRTG